MNSSRLLRSRLVSALLVGAVFVPPFLACHRETSTPQVTPAPTVAASPEAKRTAPIADTDIAQAIRRYMHEDGTLREDHVHVAVGQGIVTLSGTVGTLLAKERAVSVAETIKGVRAVVDQIDVAPIARTDEQLKSDVTSALQKDDATRPFTIGVAAKDGKVTLSGTTDSWQQRTLFGDVAKTVKGVRALGNTIALHYAAIRPESEIASDVQHRIANDVWLEGSALTVTVSNRTVHVRGVVGSVAQKLRAGSDGWVAGVDNIDDEGVMINWAARDDQRRVTDYPVRSDAVIAQAVRDAFELDPRLKPVAPHVTVENGAVVLTGTVANPTARRAAETDAKDTVGVWRVRDEVLVRAGKKMTDSDIDRRLERALSEDVLLSNAKSIKASSAQGTVFLKGTVASAFERFDAIEAVANVTGVAEVDDDLVVQRPPAEVKASIEDRIFWDPMLERDRVSVAVGPDGTTTLTGTLDSWSEIKAATDDALRGGATRSINLLKVKDHTEMVAP